MVSNDWSACPHCDFTALYSKFCHVVDQTRCCPMCNESLAPDQITLKPMALNGFVGESKENLSGGNQHAEAMMSHEPVVAPNERASALSFVATTAL
jgi:hypothetical protein